MAVDSREAAGNPYFDANSADDQAADLTELGRYALFRGGLMRGTTAEREAFSTAGYAGEGDHWDDTTLDVLYRWSGSTWVAVKARGGFTLAGSIWDSAGGIFGGGTQATLANSGATVSSRRITPSVPGQWLFVLNGVWAVNSTGLRQALLRKNGLNSTSVGAAGNYAGTLVPAQGRSEFSLSLSTAMNGTTDYVDFAVYQESGVRLELTWVACTGEKLG